MQTVPFSIYVFLMKQDMDSEAGAVRILVILKAPSLKIIFNFSYNFHFAKILFLIFLRVLSVL